ncbi:hypothetical protein PBY51_011149 [Eleginops maclovinus]|uniref:Uncharacterized protein n=1 Tax=Eleginops maclovinus TaxID=56733 RepID=A0AAN7XC00_ELEMC|nr:hypothetical protein PBY51_011149 [Eleginops maclovinus]
MELHIPASRRQTDGASHCGGGGGGIREDREVEKVERNVFPTTEKTSKSVSQFPVMVPQLHRASTCFSSICISARLAPPACATYAKITRSTRCNKPSALSVTLHAFDM